MIRNVTIFSIAFDIPTHPCKRYTKFTSTPLQLKAIIIFLIKDGISSFIFVRHWLLCTFLPLTPSYFVAVVADVVDMLSHYSKSM